MFCHVDVLGSVFQWSNSRLFVSLKFMIYVALSSISQVYFESFDSQKHT